MLVCLYSCIYKHIHIYIYIYICIYIYIAQTSVALEVLAMLLQDSVNPAKICAREVASVVSRGFQGPPMVSRGIPFWLLATDASPQNIQIQFSTLGCGSGRILNFESCQLPLT